jgi:hypothetical protein
MRDHELELIAALVEGRLEDEAEARALIRSSSELAAEYQAQKTAFDALSGVGAASLSETERASLRREVWTELRAPAATRGRTPWYYRWVPALAGMFVVVGLVAVVSQGGGDDAGEEAAARLSAETTAAESADGGAGEAGVDSDSLDEAEESTDTTSQASAGSFDLSPAATEFYSVQASMVRSGALDDPPTDETTVSPEEAAAPCLDAANLAGYVPLKILTAPIESDQFDVEALPVPSASNPVIVAIPEGSDLASAVVAFVDEGSCRVIHVDE